MSLNCSSGLFFIPSYLIIKGRKRFYCTRTDSSSCQFNSFQKERTKRDLHPKQANIFTRLVFFFLPRRCCSISNVCGLFVYYIWATIRRRIFCMPLCFFFEDIAKNMKKKGSLLFWSLVRKENAMLKKQNSSCDSCGPSVGANCRRFEYLILQ